MDFIQGSEFQELFQQQTACPTQNQQHQMGLSLIKPENEFLFQAEVADNKQAWVDEWLAISAQ